MKNLLAAHRSKQSGQTLVIALVVMAILLVLGIVFTGLVNRNILQSLTARQRAVANDLSEAGIRYAHAQLVNSRLGADWRGELIDLAPIGTDVTRDPDMLYLRPGTGFGLRSDTDPVIDLGGPDGLGPYTRVTFDNGRALVRVRWAPSDPNVFEASSVGQLRSPAAARHYLIIESFGRVGRVNPQDPTTLGSTTPIQFRNYGSSAAFRQALGEMQDADTKLTRTRKLIAFATVGIIDQAMFITNFDKVSRSADVGFPEASGASYEGNPVQVPVVLGESSPLPSPPGPPVTRPHGGGLRSNAALTVHGAMQVFLNNAFGDVWQVADDIRMDTGSASNFLDLTYFNSSTGLPVNTVVRPDSRNNPFDTIRGHIRDGAEGADLGGWPRNVGIIEGPRITAIDPQTNENRWHLLTRRSGKIGARGNEGQYGYGQGIYVDNSQDKQSASDETQRETVGAEGSLVYDWFNPGNGQRNSGWKGSFYIPRGLHIQLRADGMVLTRDGSATGNQRTWRRPDGTDSGSATIKYRFGTVNGQTMVVSSFTPGVNIDAANPNYALGMPFNGVIYCEGNVRVRGVIPTDVQLTIVSNATAYIEGSITKGVVENQVSNPGLPTSTGARLNRPSRSMLMLMAKDYVAVNTTMFFGPTVNQPLEPRGSAVRLETGSDTLSLMHELLLNPATAGAGSNPALWVPYNNNYREFIDPTPGSDNGPPLSSDLLITHTMDNGAGQYTMIGLDVNYGFGTAAFPSNYLFPLLDSPPNPQTNSVLNLGPYSFGYTTPGYAIANFVPIYGLGRESWQRATKFESITFPLVQSTSAWAFPTLTNTGGEGRYRGLVGESNYLSFRHVVVGSEPTNDYLLKRTAIVPHDIRIEASVYAEQGSFAVIPGYWYNSDPNDRREVFEANVQRYMGVMSTPDLAEATRLAQLDRMRDYGNAPKVPFYGEPLDVRVQIVGSVSHNMPLPASFQAEWLKKWGWIPRHIGAWYRFNGQNRTPVLIPKTHVPNGYNILGADLWVPNLITIYDPNLATGRIDGYAGSAANPYVRVDSFGRPLPPMPRLPVSPTLAYFGEVLR